MAKNNNPSRPTSGKTQSQKTRPQRTTARPLVILAVGVAAALAIAMYLSSRGEEPTTTLGAPVLADVSGAGHVQGAENPAITLVEYGDYECPHCAEYHLILSDVMRRLPNELALEFHHYPLPVGPNSITASLAAEAAGEQGRYWEMHDALFETQRQWSGRTDAREIFTSMAGQLGLDTARFRQDLESDEIGSRIIADKLRGNALQITGTPTFFINGQRLNYLPASADEFEELLRSIMGQ